MCNRPIILVTGATGAVGPPVVAALLGAGFRIRTLSLDFPPKGMWPDDIETLWGDITDPDVVRSAMVKVDSVIHMAALLHRVDPPPELRKQYEKVNVSGTDIVVKAAIHANVKRIVFFSTIAIYGHSEGGIFQEETSPRPQTFYAQTKLSAEQIVLGAKNFSGQPIGTVLRLGAVYGSKVKGNYLELLKALANGRFIPIGHGRNRRTLIYDKDVGRAVVLAVSHPAAAGRVFNVTDGEFHTLNEIIESICAALGRKPPKFSIPVGFARFLAGILECGAQLVGYRSSVTRMAIDKYTEEIAVSGKRIQKELGFNPRYDLKTGWKEAIPEMRESHVL
jgi:nucleoside-diphosphate-sugar epimerase